MNRHDLKLQKHILDVETILKKVRKDHLSPEIFLEVIRLRACDPLVTYYINALNKLEIE